MSAPLDEDHSPNSADLVLQNGKIVTLDPKNSIAQAVAIKGDKILAFGTNYQIHVLVGPQTKSIDLQGKTVTPGIVDSHIHLLYYGKQFSNDLLDIRYPAVKDEKDLLSAIANKAKTLAKGEWISGNQGFRVDPNVKLDRWELDDVRPTIPYICVTQADNML